MLDTLGCKYTTYFNFIVKSSEAVVTKTAICVANNHMRGNSGRVNETAMDALPSTIKEVQGVEHTPWVLCGDLNQRKSDTMFLRLTRDTHNRKLARLTIHCRTQTFKH